MKANIKVGSVLVKADLAMEELWLRDPEEHDYPAAMDFLSLLMDAADTLTVVQNLRTMPTDVRKAKDILRASGLPLLPADNPHVAHNIAKVHAGKRLSPVLLVRSRPLIIADGYHRICAAYHLTEDLDVPCRLTVRVY